LWASGKIFLPRATLRGDATCGTGREGCREIYRRNAEARNRPLNHEGLPPRRLNCGHEGSGAWGWRSRGTSVGASRLIDSVRFSCSPARGDQGVECKNSSDPFYALKKRAAIAKVIADSGHLSRGFSESRGAKMCLGRTTSETKIRAKLRNRMRLRK
jgi:hypothetical protein